MNKVLMKDIFEWDRTNWSKSLPFWLNYLPENGESKICLELGANNGGLSLWLANLGFDVVCSDLENPIGKANSIHSNYDLKGKISYEAIDALAIPYQNYFDIVIFKSILGGVSRDGKNHLKAKMLNQILNCLKPGGILLFAENLKSTSFHEFLRKNFVRWGNEWNYLKIEELSSLFENYSECYFKYAGFLGALGRNECQRNILGTVDNFIEGVIPDNSKYIIFGACKK